MKRIISLFAAALLTASAWAVPALPGQWKTIRLSDGSQVRVELKGDEYGHFWESADGSVFTENSNGQYVRQNRVALVERINTLRKERLAEAAANPGAAPMLSPGLKAAGTAPGANGTNLKGNKRCLVILAEFQDCRFQDEYNRDFYNDFCNKEGFSEGYATGSARDYFRDQSNGQLIIDFDVVGPVLLDGNVADYGGNSSNGSDKNPRGMVLECINSVDDEVDFSIYDWGNNGYVDEIFIIYAGKGEASGGAAETIWPHKWALAQTVTKDGKKISVYACSCELSRYNVADGIGTMCHEFSHCMGFPDMYDTGYSGAYGMGTWDLMCSGSYNGQYGCGEQPAGYSGYEKWCCGWQDPIELTEDLAVTDMQPLSKHGDFYIVKNKENANEFFILENRQKDGWDASLSGKGMLIAHIDYNSGYWARNNVNTVSTNDGHEHITIFHADNSGTRYDESNDTYPYGKRDSLTNNSLPAAKLWSANSDGKKYMNVGIQKIKQNSDGTIAFNFEAVNKTIGEGAAVDGETVLFESFSECEGTGGNDGSFSGSVGSGSFVSDLVGWDNGSNNKTDNCKGANKCAYFNNVSPRSPSFDVEGTVTISFKAAPFSFDNTTLTVTSTNSAITLTDTEFTMVKGQFTAFTTTLTGTGSTRLQFSNGKRFFLDEVLVYIPESTGIISINDDMQRTAKNDDRIYNINGQYVGNTPSLLQKGIYIINGKKVVIK